METTNKCKNTRFGNTSLVIWKIHEGFQIAKSTYPDLEKENDYIIEFRIVINDRI